MIAGGLRNEPGGAFSGGLWVMEVASKERALQLIAQDPYAAHGNRGRVLKVWGKALPDLPVQL